MAYLRGIYLERYIPVNKVCFNMCILIPPIKSLFYYPIGNLKLEIDRLLDAYL